MFKPATKRREPNREDVFSAASALKQYLERREITYALVGGLAVHMWGHDRMTDDVDFAVIPPGSDDEVTSTKIQILRDAIAKGDSRFLSEIKKPPLEYFTDKTDESSATVGCDLLGAPGIAGPALTDITTVRTSSHEKLGDVVLLRPPYLLYSKLMAWSSRGNSNLAHKAISDSSDIKFLVERVAAEHGNMAKALAHWGGESSEDRLAIMRDHASKWVHTGDGLGGRGMGTEKCWEAIGVQLM